MPFSQNVSSSSRSLSTLEQTLKTRLITDVDELCRRLELPETLASTVSDAAREFPLLFPESLLNRVRKGTLDDPILAQFLPNSKELEHVPGFSTDPLEEQAETSSCLLQKYAGRVLALTTDACAARCRFCFRRHFPKNRGLFPLPSERCLEKSPVSNESPTEYFDRIFASVRADSSIRELIFSGGDPMTLSNAELTTLLHYIKSIESVKRVRFHSRVPILSPARIDANFPGIDDIVDFNGSNVIPPFVLHLTLHANSPNEIDANVECALRELRRRGYVLTSQTVLLKGINDSVDVLSRLFEKLIDVGVVPYYLHQLDRVQGAAAFEVPVATGLQLVRELGERLPGYATPKYVREIPNRPMKTNLFLEKDAEPTNNR